MKESPQSVGSIPPTVEPIASVIQIIVFRDMCVFSSVYKPVVIV